MPFVTLAGLPSVGRLGASILTAVGHPEWIASSEADYVEIAAALAANVRRLAKIKVALRDEISASPLSDEVGFARSVESSHRAMWRRWCAGERPDDCFLVAAAARPPRLVRSDKGPQARAGRRKRRASHR